MKKKLLLSLTALFLTLTSTLAYDFSDNSTGITLYYTIHDSTVSVTHPNSSAPYWTSQPSGSLIIPYSVVHNNTTYTVTAIDNNTFVDCIYLTSVEIPHTVTTIGWNAFYGCTNLYSIKMSNTVTTIGDHAFFECSNLTDITLPNTLTNIDFYLFNGCTALTRINIPNSVTSINYGAFSDCILLDSLIIPASVRSIGNFAFSNCRSMHYLEIGAGINSIGYTAFDGCSSLDSIRILNAYPPAIQNNTFSSYTHNLPVYIPCGSLNRYNQASNWSLFYNFIEENCGRTVTVVSEDERKGLVNGGGIYPVGSTATLKAASFAGYKFDHWNENITDNPLNVTITDDVTYTAYFTNADTAVIHDTTIVHDTINIHDTIIRLDTITIHDTIIRFDTITILDTIFVHDTLYIYPTYYELKVFSGNSQRGFVAGNGIFPDSSFVEIAAIPFENSKFIQWQDGNTDNPRIVQLLGEDADYVATFEQGSSIDNISADNDFQVTSHNNQIVVTNVPIGEKIRIFDTTGRVVNFATCTHDCTTFIIPVSGVYFVQAGNATAKRIVVR